MVSRRRYNYPALVGANYSFTLAAGLILENVVGLAAKERKEHIDRWIHESANVWSLHLPGAFGPLDLEAEIQFSVIFAFFCGKIAAELRLIVISNR